MAAQRENRRASSTINQLPHELRLQLDARLGDTGNTYNDLSEWLKGLGHEISKSAIGRYALRTSKAAQRVSDTLQRTQALAAAVEAHPDLDYTKAASMVLMDGLMQRVSTAEDDFSEMPLDKAGRLIASLSRGATYEKRVRFEMKKKLEHAFEELEHELMAAIKQDSQLSAELSGLLLKAKERMLADDTA